MNLNEMLNEANNGPDRTADTLLSDVDPDDNFLNEILQSNENFPNSEIYTLDRFNATFVPNDSLFSVLNCNIRSFTANCDPFIGLLSSIKFIPEILTLSETWIKDASDQMCNISGYTAFHTVRLGGRGGGVSVYCRDNLRSTLVNHLCITNITIESCVVRISLAKEEMFVVAIYRPHSDTIANFSLALEALLLDPILKRKKIILCGDFNINLLAQCSTTSSFISLLQSMNFIPAISKPTRYASGLNSSDSPSLLDHTWLNFLDHTYSAIIYTDISDHCPTVIRLPVVNKPSDKIKLTFRCHSLENVDKYLSSLNNMDILYDCNNPNRSVADFVTQLDHIYCKSFPVQTKYVSVSRLKKPWLTSGLMKSIRMKSHYFKLYKLGIVSSDFNREYRNKLNILIRKSKRLYYREIFESRSSDVKRSWHNINRCLGNLRKRSNIDHVIVGGNTIDDRQLIAESFNDYFSSIAINLDSQIPDHPKSPLDFVNVSLCQSLFLTPMTPTECINIISTMKNKYFGNNSAPTKIFKLAKNIVSNPICKLFNLCIEKSVFPDILKCGTVTPVFKSGDISLLSNYRPITVLILLSKIFEKALHSRLSSFLEKHSIISPCQYGFQKGKSTAEAIVNLTELIYGNLNSGDFNCTVFVDLKKAFDTVNHNILFLKLERYGIRGIALDFIKSYLRDRKCKVRIGEALSSDRITNIGIPQGSIVAPLLFVLYVNDLPNVSQLFHTILFADDTTLSTSDNDYSTLVDNVNRELDSVRTWTLVNRLSLNVSKTFYMIFANRPYNVEQYPVSFNNHAISCKQSGKFLGLSLDCNLNFGDHLNVICNKISKTVGIMYKLRDIVPEFILLKLYYSLIYPYIIYCNTIWGGTNYRYISPLIILQKRAIRIISGADYLAHTNPLFIQSDILKVIDIHNYLLAIHMFKSYTFNVPPVHDYDTRNRSALRFPFNRLTRGQQAVSISGPRVWNTIPIHIKSALNLNSFKHLYKEYLIESYVEL